MNPTALNYPAALDYLTPMPIGARIRKIRRDKELSQEYVAEKIGVTTAYISKIENEKSDPDSELIKKFALVLGVTVADLFGEETKTVNEPPAHYILPAHLTDNEREKIERLIGELSAASEADRALIYEIIRKVFSRNTGLTPNHGGPLIKKQ